MPILMMFFPQFLLGDGLNGGKIEFHFSSRGRNFHRGFLEEDDDDNTI